MSGGTLGKTGVEVGKIAYGERPRRREPGTVSADSDIYLASSSERAQTIQAAYEAGIRFFHVAYEREAASLGQSLQTLGIRDQIITSTTDGDALARCPDTEAGGAAAIQGAIARKLELLQVEQIDLFSLYDFRRDVHTSARLAGAQSALLDAQSAGRIRFIGATCYDDYEALADGIELGIFLPDVVITRCNYYDRRAMSRLIPLGKAHGIGVLAAQPFSWVGGVPFVAFPNTWRYRNLTKNFYGFTAGQAHLKWLLDQDGIDGVLVSMQTPEQITENIAAAQITKTPQGLESLFDSFIEAIIKTREGWRGLRQSDDWEYRTAAETYLGK